MALLTVNVLPDPISVNRPDGDVYHWFQTTELISPFDAIIPIDHGYFFLSYETGPVSDGFLPEPDALGWVLFTNDPHNLPVDLLDPELLNSAIITFDSTTEIGKFFSPVIGATINSSLLEKSFTSPITLDFSEQNRLIYSATSFFDFKEREKDIVFSAVRQIDTSFVKQLEISPQVSIDISLPKEISYAGVVEIDISDLEIVFADPLTIDISGRDNIFSTVRTINFLEREKNLIISDIKTIDITGKLNTFAAPVTINIEDVEKDKVFTSIRTIDISAIHRVFNSSIVNINVRDRKKNILYSDATTLDITTVRDIFYSSIRSIDINDIVLQFHSSSIFTIDIFSDKDFAFSSVAEINIAGLGPETKDLEFSSVVSIDINTSQKLFVFSGLRQIDIAFTDEVQVIIDEDWILFKRFGVRCWKFLSFMRHDTRLERLTDLKLSVDSNYEGILDASQITEITFDPIDGSTTRVQRFYDDAKTEIAEDIFIAYNSGLPTSMDILQYDIFGHHLRTMTETFTIVGETLTSTGVTILEIVPPPIALPFTGPDQPGVGDNIIEANQCRIWTDTSVTPNRTYLVARAANGEYHATETSNIE